jgi:hypothetical protein
MSLWAFVFLWQRGRRGRMRLPGRYAVTDALAGALKSVAWVAALEHV